MTTPDPPKNAAFYQEIRQQLRLANQAVAEAQAENRRLGLPELHVIQGKLWYALPDGTLTDELPAILQEG